MAYYQTALSVKDRTSEFHTLVDSNRPDFVGQSTISPRERLLASGGPSSSSSLAASRAGTPSQQQHHHHQQQQNGSAAASSPKGEFAKRAQAIGKDISDTTAKLGRLAQRALPRPSSSSLFSHPLTAVFFAQSHGERRCLTTGP